MSKWFAKLGFPRWNGSYEYSTEEVWLGVYRLHRKKGHEIVNDLAASYGVHVQNTGYIDEGLIHLPGGSKTNQVVLPQSVPPFKRISAIPLVGSFQAALVYAGKRGSVIQLIYHEYLDGSRQPAYTQALTYDLAVSVPIDPWSQHVHNCHLF